MKSIGAFKKALDAEVISWVDPYERIQEELVWKNSVEIVGSRTPILRQLQYSLHDSRNEAERLIAQSTLVSIHSFWRWHVLWAYKTCRRYDVPYWFVPHGSLDPFVIEGENAGFKKVFLQLGGKAFLRDAATIIYSTQKEREKATLVTGTDRGDVVNWPLSQEDFNVVDRQDRSAARSDYKIAEDEICFLYLGRLTPMKRPLETIEAFAKAGPRNAQLIMIGNEHGVTIDQCQKAAAKFGVGDRVHVLGSMYGKEKQRIISAADVYISLSHRENFNFTAAETLAAGLALILSPGNDLAHELKGLPGVYLLDDVENDTVTSSIRVCEEIGVEQLSLGRRERSTWALNRLSTADFQSRLQNMSMKYGLETC